MLRYSSCKVLGAKAQRHKVRFSATLCLCAFVPLPLNSCSRQEISIQKQNLRNCQDSLPVPAVTAGKKPWTFRPMSRNLSVGIASHLSRLVEARWSLGLSLLLKNGRQECLPHQSAAVFPEPSGADIPVCRIRA